MNTKEPGDIVIVSETHVAVVNGKTSSRVSVDGGWITFSTTTLHKKKVNVDLAQMGSDLPPGYPDITHSELWVALIKVGFPLDEMDFAKANVLTSNVMSTYGRDPVDVGGWLDDLGAEEHEEQFRNADLHNIEQIMV